MATVHRHPGGVTEPSDPLAAKIPAALTGGEPFTASGQATGVTVVDFWRWSASDLLGNALRGLVAEYLVAHALGATGQPRQEWAAYDVVTPDGVTVEVKSAAYLQSWRQAAMSKLIFGIQETRGWDAATNTYEVAVRRQADVYVFCLLAHQDKATVDPLNLDQWQFYVLPSRQLDAELGPQRSASLNTLIRVGARLSPYPDLGNAVSQAAPG